MLFRLHSKSFLRLVGLRSTDERAALLGFSIVAATAAADGGYWPTAWGWTSLALAWVAALGLQLGDVRVSRLELVAVGAWTALLGWILLSAAWSTSTTKSMLEAQRAVVYVAGLSAIVVLVRARGGRGLLGGTWAAITLVAAYGLLTRLVPDRVGTFDPVASYRLSEPVGYWNALGILVAAGALLALGLAVYAARSGVRAAAGASLLVLLPALYFTFSRGAWIALGIGLAASIVLDPRRMRTVTTALVLAPTTALGLALAYRSDALSRVQPSLREASQAGHRLALELLVLAVVTGAAILAVVFLEDRVSVSDGLRRAYAVGLALVAVVAISATLVRLGGPVRLAGRAYDAFAAPAPRIEGSLNRRLFNLSGSGRIPQWRVAWADFEARPLLGFGAGTFERRWVLKRSIAGKIRDAHTLYLETLAELGALGLAILVTALSVPLVAAARARRHPLVPAALGVYVAYLAHAGVDWDWEMPAVTLTALFCAGAMLVAARDGHRSSSLGARARAVGVTAAVTVAIFGAVGLLANGALSASASAALAGRGSESEAHARNAMRFAPWSSEAWQLVAEAQLARGELVSARASFRTAIEKDPGDWELWTGLALASKGNARREAALKALALNPLSPELNSFRAFLRLPARAAR